MQGFIHRTQEFVAWNARIYCIERKKLLHGMQGFIAITLFFVHKK